VAGNASRSWIVLIRLLCVASHGDTGNNDISSFYITHVLHRTNLYLHRRCLVARADMTRQYHRLRDARRSSSPSEVRITVGQEKEKKKKRKRQSQVHSHDTLDAMSAARREESSLLATVVRNARGLHVNQVEAVKKTFPPATRSVRQKCCRTEQSMTWHVLGLVSQQQRHPRRRHGRHNLLQPSSHWSQCSRLVSSCITPSTFHYYHHLLAQSRHNLFLPCDETADCPPLLPFHAAELSGKLEQRATA